MAVKPTKQASYPQFLDVDNFCRVSYSQLLLITLWTAKNSPHTYPHRKSKGGKTKHDLSPACEWTKVEKIVLPDFVDNNVETTNPD